MMTESSGEALSIMEWPRVVREETEDWWAEISDTSACVCVWGGGTERGEEGYVDEWR